MGMDIYGQSGNYFRANIWQWRALCHAMELAEYTVPSIWHSNDGGGLRSQPDCDTLANQLDDFLKRWDGHKIVLETEGLRVDKTGGFVDPGTPNSHSPYWIGRDHLEEFVEFLKTCGGGFNIH